MKENEMEIWFVDERLHKKRFICARQSDSPGQAAVQLQPRRLPALPHRRFNQSPFEIWDEEAMAARTGSFTVYRFKQGSNHEIKRCVFISLSRYFSRPPVHSWLILRQFHQRRSNPGPSRYVPIVRRPSWCKRRPRHWRVGSLEERTPCGER